MKTEMIRFLSHLDSSVYSISSPKLIGVENPMPIRLHFLMCAFQSASGYKPHLSQLFRSVSEEFQKLQKYALKCFRCSSTFLIFVQLKIIVMFLCSSLSIYIDHNNFNVVKFIASIKSYFL